MTHIQQDWWRGGVLYQIYPRSFMDASDDGVGDLVGIIERLEYIASLGVDAIWISPFFKSPMKDFGYDVSDYRDVDPLFGSLSDFDQLVHRAHELGLKVTIDQVLSHTSDQHPWFQESRQDKTNPKADWYVWADPNPDGTVPNNWLSIFGGTGWQWEPRRQQYYLHNFLVSQPDLNFHNPEVRQQLLDETEFWLQRGVDGFRLDTANFYFHDQQFRNNPPRPPEDRAAQGFSPNNPYAYQYHIYDKTQPENLGFLADFRALLDRYPGTTTVAEIGADDALTVMAEYTSGGDKLHMGYSFEFLGSLSDAAYIRATIEALEAKIGDGWPCWVLTNHDVERVITRWGGDQAPDAYAKILMAMLLSLRGSACIYQGDELGLPQADIPYEQLQDPFGIAFWPEFKGRDGCRTPMPWRHDGPAADFSQHQPWLPIPEEHRWRAVDMQDHVPGSILNAYRTFLHWRRDHPALKQGSIRFIDAPEGVLLFERSHDSERILVCLNLTAETKAVPVTEHYSLTALYGHGFAGLLHDGQLELPAFEAFYGTY